MGLEVGFGVEFFVVEGNIEHECVIEKGAIRDYFGMTFQVKANITAENDRSLTGEIHFYSNSDSSPDDQQGEWIFYTADRFRADIYAPAAQLEKMWMVFATKPQWFLISIGEGPEVAQLSTTVTGSFRFSYRAGRIVPPDDRY
jgi:hypothetical protein